MSKFMIAAAAASLVVLSGARASFAQLVVGGTSTTIAGSAYYIDVTSDPANPHAYTLWNQTGSKKVNGIAGNEAFRQMYSNDAARLNVWNYNTPGVQPTTVAGIYRTNGTSFTATGFDDLAWANDKLYGYTTFASSVFKRGIYQINTVPDSGSHCVATLLWGDTNTVAGTQYAFSISFNSADNLFYGLNNVAGAPGGTGLYTIDAFGSGALNKLAALPDLSGVAGLTMPSTYTNWDGIALGGGNLWLVTHDLADAAIVVIPWNMTTQLYDYTNVLALPYDGASQRTVGATWSLAALPEPGALAALLPLAGLVARKRR